MAYHYMSGLLVRPGEESTYGHLQGGPTTDPGAKCQVCHRPLLRIWQLDCSDPRLVKASPQEPAFAGLTTLPLYYCWRCGGEYAYQVKADGMIEMLDSKVWNQPPGDDFPYPNYPSHFPQRPIRLYRPDELPEVVWKYVNDDPDDIGEPIPPQDAQLLSDFFGHKIKIPFHVWWHQLGGIPALAQGKEEHVCPNPACPRTAEQKKTEPMKILAAIPNDPPSGLPMIESVETVEEGNGHFNRWVQAVFHVCDACFTVHACNRCD